MKEKRFETVVIALLSIGLAICTYTAVQVQKIVRDGLNLEITLEEAEELVEAAISAENDMNEEGE